VIRIRFQGRDGSVTDAAGMPGDRLLDVAKASGQPLEGTCDGGLACATCHVVVDPADFGRLTAASEEEEDMLDLAPDATRTSRLSCQILLHAGLDGLAVRIP
jgi:ferredoxin